MSINQNPSPMKTKNTHPGSTTIRLFLTLAAVVFMTISCQQDEQESILTPVVTTNSDKLKLEFGKSLTTALASEPLVRSFLKQEAMKMMDGDFDIVYALVKNERLSNNKTLEQTLSGYFGGLDKLRKIEESLPLLTIFIPSLPENSFSAEKWNPETEVPFVAIRLNTSNDGPIISPEGEEYILDAELIPSYPVVVIKENERMTVTGVNGFKEANGTRSFSSGSRSYKFVDDVFDNALQAKKKETLRIVQDYQIDQKLHDAFSLYSSVDGWHRDYIYYNITPSNPNGPFRYDFVETITHFNIVGDARAIYNVIADQTGDPRIKEGKKSSGWTEGSFEIRAHVLVQAKNGTGSSISNATYVTGPNLFNVTYRVEKRGTWPFRYDYYIINTVTARPQNTNISIVNWDLNRYASAFRVDIEESDNTEVVTISSSETVKFASNFEFNPSFGTDIKLGLKFGASQEVHY